MAGVLGFSQPFRSNWTLKAFFTFTCATGLGRYLERMKTAYDEAMEKSGRAIREFSWARMAYRNRTIGDAEYLAARKAYEAAMAEYDAAFAAASESESK